MDPDSKVRRQPGGAENRRGRRLHVSVTDGRGRSVRDGGLSQWLASIAPSVARGEVAIALVTDAHSQTLNSQYRRKNRPTDVLSFPVDPGSRIPDPGQRIPTGFLGDIVIATGTARKQARDAGHSYQAELRVLALHGLLHLLGYDHHNQEDAGRMRRVETRLRRRGGLRAGLIERS
ncbi:MAG TPA: rRNA maturation RNase YbeY [Vicinamibacterales bacterium]|nr:rRNA maturation RNase YbeY [Vicinamibacterales bacterium]